MKTRKIILLISIVTLCTSALTLAKVCRMGQEIKVLGEKQEELIHAEASLRIDAEEILSPEVQNPETMENATEETDNEQPTETVEEPVSDPAEQEEQTEEVTFENVDVSQLSEEEIEARKQRMRELVAKRAELYAMPNSIEKTKKINEIDKMILANNVYNYSDKAVVFVGDSITAGVGATVQEDGTQRSYVDYANDYLQIGQLLKYGKPGRMFTDYSGEEFAALENRESLFYLFADTTVVFLGVNDFLNVKEDKLFGSLEDKISTKGFCGHVRGVLNYLTDNVPNTEVLFVIMYPVDSMSSGICLDTPTQPQLKEFLDAEIALLEEYGVKYVNLYSEGIIDGTVQELKDAYLFDGLHPNDTGYKILGEHIAAEIVINSSLN